MGLTKGNSFSDEIIGKIGCQHLKTEGFFQIIRIGFHGDEDASGDGKTIFDSIDSLKQGYFILLQILVVSPGQSLETGGESNRSTKRDSRFSAEKFESIWIFFSGA